MNKTKNTQNNLELLELDNGIKFIYAQRKDLESSSLQVWFRVGSIYENYQEKGIAHFLEHMLFNGSKKHKRGIDKDVENMGGYINAATSKEYTFYYIDVGSIFNKKAAYLLEDLTLHPLLEEKKIEKEKPIVLEELKRGKDKPSTFFWEELEKLCYKVSPYQYPIIGFEETIKNFNRELLTNFYDNFYQPSNMGFVLVGNFDKKDISYIVKLLEKNSPKPLKIPEIPLEPPQKQQRFKEITHHLAEHTYLAIAYRAPSILSKDYYSMVVFNNILGEGKLSILYESLVIKGLVQTYFTGDFERPRDNLFIFYAKLEKENVDKVKKEFIKAVNKIKDMPQEEFERAKERIIDREDFHIESADSHANMIGYSFAVAGSLNFFEHFKSNIKTVRKVDVIKFIEKYIKEESSSQLIMNKSE